MEYSRIQVNDHQVHYIQVPTAQVPYINPLFLSQRCKKSTSLHFDLHPVIHIEDLIVGDCIIVASTNSFAATTVYDGGIEMYCKYSLFRWDQVEKTLTAHHQLYRDMMDILMSRGLTNVQTLAFLNNLFINNSLEGLNYDDVLNNCRTLNINHLVRYYERCLLKNGEPPSLYVNSYFESASQKSLNVKHKNLRGMKDAKVNLTCFEDVASCKPLQFYFICPPIDYTVLVPKSHYTLFVKKNYGNIFTIIDDGFALFAIGEHQTKSFCTFARTKNLNIKVESWAEAQKLYNLNRPIIHANNQKIFSEHYWYYFTKEHFSEMDGNVLKSVTMGKKSEYNEFRVLILKSEFNSFVRYCKWIDIFTFYCESFGYLNCSFYIRNTKDSAHHFLEQIDEYNNAFKREAFTATNNSPHAQPSDQFAINIEENPDRIFTMSNDSTSAQIEEQRLAFEKSLNHSPIQLIYTNALPSNSVDESKHHENYLRLLYMKRTNSNDPYPNSAQKELAFNLIKISYHIARATNTKIDSSKSPIIGAMSNVFSERGLVTVADVRVHNKPFKENTMNSAIFSNMPSKTNLNNENLVVKF